MSEKASDYIIPVGLVAIAAGVVYLIATKSYQVGSMLGEGLVNTYESLDKGLTCLLDPNNSRCQSADTYAKTVQDWEQTIPQETKDSRGYVITPNPIPATIAGVDIDIVGGLSIHGKPGEYGVPYASGDITPTFFDTFGGETPTSPPDITVPGLLPLPDVVVAGRDSVAMKQIGVTVDVFGNVSEVQKSGDQLLIGGTDESGFTFLIGGTAATSILDANARGCYHSMATNSNFCTEADVDADPRTRNNPLGDYIKNQMRAAGII
jgi:hypothetical protein